MKKLAAFSVFGAAGLPGQAMAVDIVTVQCSIFTPSQVVFAIQASAGVTTPASCAPGATSSCSQCVAALLSDGFKLANSFESTQVNSGYAGPYFVFKR
jgi:hypothetical protein